MTPSPHSSTVPPNWAERLLRAAVRDADWRDAVSGDLREEFATVASRHGFAAARRWYCRQALPLAARFAAGRLVPAMTPPRRRRVSVADLEHTSLLGAGWSRELRHAWRALGQRPALSAVIAGTLAVALAANAVIFNLADALYLRPFRLFDVDRLVLIASDSVGDRPYFDRESVAPADYRDWTRALTTVPALAAVEWWDPTLSGVERPESLHGFRVTPGYFELLGVGPSLGRSFTAEDGHPNANRTVILSHAFWVRHFNADPDVLGRTMRLEGAPHEVVGVMPPRFVVPYGAEVWAPVGYDEAAWAERRRGSLMVFGRLGDGQTLEAARAEVTAVVARQAAEFPDTNRNRPVMVVSFDRGLGDDAVGPFVAIWQAAAVLLLLIACANIANLLLARGTERQPEFAVRLALGASRWRLGMQLLIEGVCLAVIGIAVGTALAAGAITLSRGFLPATVVRFVPGYEYIQLDAATFAAMAALGALATIVFSLVPAVQAAGAGRVGPIVGGARASTAPPGRQWLRSVLAGAQVALTVALVVAAALIVGAVNRAAYGATGFDREQLITAQLTLPEGPYQDLARRRRFTAAVLDRLRGLPGVTQAGAANVLPYTNLAASRPLVVEGRPIDDTAPERRVDLQRATPEYLETLRIPLLRGRALTAGDGADAPPTALVSQRLAEEYFPGEDPIGQRVRLAKDGEWVTIVGVVGDIVQDWFIGRKNPTVYRPLEQDPPLNLTFAARTAGDPMRLAADVQRAVVAADPDQPIEQLASMEEVIRTKVAGINYFARVLTTMSGIALALALTGMYSLMAYLAARRTREIGVRMALGATRRQVEWLTASRAGRIALAGAVAGAALAIALGQVMRSALFGLIAPNTAVVAAAAIALVVVTVAAGYLPARRAARQDPWLALRTE
ncbi:MAG: ADOP family duplicated permease [Vicinamibacterales bacterium]